MTNQVHVAVGVIQDASGSILVAKRGAHQHLANKWEFPGGKVEPGESVLSALKRELCEELGIEARLAEPLIQIPFHYPDKKVLLDVWVVKSFAGEARGREGQQIAWVESGQLGQLDFPQANKPIVLAIFLPTVIAISGEFSDLQDCISKSRRAIESGAQAIMLRTKGDASLSSAAVKTVREFLYDRNAELILHSSVLQSLGQQDVDCLALHLESKFLLEQFERPKGCRLLGASCHSRRELELAVQLGCDYVSLSPVKPTLSHPQAETIGWDAFRTLVADCPIPVYALGGLSFLDLSKARSYGAQGVVCLSSLWGKT